MRTKSAGVRGTCPGAGVLKAPVTVGLRALGLSGMPPVTGPGGDRACVAAYESRCFLGGVSCWQNWGMVGLNQAVHVPPQEGKAN